MVLSLLIIKQGLNDRWEAKIQNFSKGMLVE